MHAGDVQRLIQIIVEEFAALQRQGRPDRCACHAVLYECCADRLRGVLDAGAPRLGLHAAGGATGSVASMIDHTLLKPDATRTDIETLCREAAEYRFASVCVNPTWVATCARLLQGTGVPVHKRYVVDGQAFYYRNAQHPGAPLKDVVQVFYQFKNEQRNGLGAPMPAGNVRVYQEDSKGGTQFVG